MSQPHASIPTPAQGAPVPPLNQGEWAGPGMVHCLCYPACLSVSPTPPPPSPFLWSYLCLLSCIACVLPSVAIFFHVDTGSVGIILYTPSMLNPPSVAHVAAMVPCPPWCSHGPLSSMVQPWSPVLHGAAMVHSPVLHGAVVHSLSPIRSWRDVPPNVLAPLGPAHQPTPAGGSKCSQPAPRWRGAADATSHHPQRGEMGVGEAEEREVSPP